MELPRYNVIRIEITSTQAKQLLEEPNIITHWGINDLADPPVLCVAQVPTWDDWYLHRQEQEFLHGDTEHEGKHVVPTAHCEQCPDKVIVYIGTKGG